MTKELTEKLEAAIGKTTKGEWSVYENVVYKNTTTLADCPITAKAFEEPAKANAEFIALAHNLLPELLEYVKGLEREIEMLRQYGNKDCTAMADEELRKLTGKGQCRFVEAWIGRCKVTADEFCEKHNGRLCSSCGAPATHNCDSTGQLVCGANLCDDCEHTIFPNGTNGGVGFDAEEMPEEMKRHCKKTEQRYKPWWQQSSLPASPTEEEKGRDEN